MLGSRNYIEKRDFMRMALDCPVDYVVSNSRQGSKSGVCVDLSAKGISFLCEDAIPEGAMIDISVKPQLAISPPFNAQMKIVRVEQMSDGVFSVAGTIELVS